MSNDVRLQPALLPVMALSQPTAVSAPARAEARTFDSIGRLPPEPERSSPRDTAPKRDLAELAKELSDLVQAVRRELQFSVDEDSGRTVIKVIDSQTGELVRQIPPEEVMTLVGRFREQQAGLLREQA
jgi:flagellar protein FlaG